MGKKVEIQKGPVVLDMRTYKNSTYAEKCAVRHKEREDLKSGVTLTMHTPKQ